MRYSYRLGSGIRILVGASVAAIALGLNAPPAVAEDTASGTAVSAAPPAANAPADTKRAATTAATGKTTQSSGKPYFIEFRARNAASYGHMYVFYGQVNGRGEVVKSDIAGHHPAGDANNCENCSVFNWTIGHLLFVPSEMGASDGDLEEKYVTARYRVMLTAAEYKRIVAHINKIKADPPLWNALWRNCVGFGNSIADLVGLKTPSFIWLEPKDYVQHLRELNGGKPQGPLKFAASGGSVKTSSVDTSSLQSSLATSGASSAQQKSAASPAPQKPKKQPVANVPAPAPAPVAVVPAYGTPQ